MSNAWYLKNPKIHANRKRTSAESSWVQSFDCQDMKPLIICRGPIRMEAMCVFEEMGITGFGILLSENDSITYPNALSPELRKSIHPDHIHRVVDYTGATSEERTRRIDEIISIARAHHYNAIFAGYGFMAEDEDMVSAMEDAGLNFMGPCSDTIRGAGRKDLAKRTALAVGVSVTPGIDNITTKTLLRSHPSEASLRNLAESRGLSIEETHNDSIEALAEAVLEASYNSGIDVVSIEDLATTLTDEIRKLFSESPQNRIRLKAIGGGGGKGQRILSSPSHYSGSDAEKIEQAVAPTASMFREVLSEVKATGKGDNKNVLAELNIEAIRHEEIQVVGNGDWCITMGGRDCSIQMNEQKLLEVSVTVEELQQAIETAESAGNDAAANTLRTDLRILQELEQEAASFGAAVGLDSVSTFECIVERDRHFFMEMNTRVQVEHRVTELCYSLKFSNPDNAQDFFIVDSIVELMVLLARHGERLPEPQRQRRAGVALEMRLNATDDGLKPHAGGYITQWSDPQQGEIRDDQGICLRNPDTDVFMKYHLAGAYDSNIALIITTGEERRDCYANMAEVLRLSHLAGENLETNLPFHYGLVNWLIGNNVAARPGTNFVSPYLAAIGQLKIVASDLDIVAAYAAIQHQYLQSSTDDETRTAINNIFEKKTSLLARVLNRMLAEPHYLGGWLALNQGCFNLDDTGITWKTNPVLVLQDLYHYLNMDSREGHPALYAIWDHDKALLDTSIEFYRELEAQLGTSDFPTLTKKIKSKNKSVTNEMRAAHNGYQMGLEMLGILPFIGMKSGFFNLKVNADLSINIPESLRGAALVAESMKALSPPPAAAADEITAPTGGMYYAREAPDQPPFIAEGDHFDEGDALFIIEVMKMFNKVYAPFAGTVRKIELDTDATIVKRGQRIFHVEPDNPVQEDAPMDHEQFTQEKTSEFIRFAGFGDHQ